MNRPSWKSLLAGGILGLALLATTSAAEAGWGHRASWGCCYSPCYVSCYRPWNSCNWGWGYSGCYGGYYGGYYGSYWGGYATATCCGDSIGPAVPSAPTPAPTPAPTAAPTPARKPVIDEPLTPEPAAPSPPTPGLPGPSEAMPKTSGATAEQSGVLTVWVPYDAKVTVNGLETRSTGSRRQFVSYGLTPGFSYNYVVKAQIVRKGQVVEDTQTVTLTAGQITAVAFGFNTAPQRLASR